MDIEEKNEIKLVYSKSQVYTTYFIFQDGERKGEVGYICIREL